MKNASFSSRRLRLLARLAVPTLAAILTSWGNPVWLDSVAAIGPTPPIWEPRETVATQIARFTNHTSSDRILAFDHHGNPGIAFSAVSTGSSDELRYARRAPGIGWAHQIVDDALVGPVTSVSMAFDRREHPAVSYYEDFNGTLRHASFDGLNWNVESMPVSSPDNEGTALAFDLLGRRAVAYDVDLGPQTLEFRHDLDGDGDLADETAVTITNNGATTFGTIPSMAFDSINRPMIAHRNGSLVQFSINDPGLGWATATVDNIGNTSNNDGLSFAIDPDNSFPAIAYNSNATSTPTVRFAQWNGNSWDLMTIATDATEPSLAFDPADGNPAISYYDLANEDLMLAWHDGTMWQTQIVDGVGDVGRKSSLAFNDFGNGFPSIAYFDGQSGVCGSCNLYYIADPATEPDPLGLLDVADTVPSNPTPVPEPTTAAVTLSGLIATLLARRRQA